MALANVNGDKDEIITQILHRLDRVEKRLCALERHRKNTPTANGDCDRARSPSFRERFADNVVIVGLREIASIRHTGIIRMTWVVIFLVCLTWTGYFVYKTCSEYLGEPTATKVKLMESAQYEYPDILLCPAEWLDSRKVLADGLTEDGLRYALGYLINFYVRPPPYRIDNYSQAIDDFQTYFDRRGFKNLVDFFKWAALDSNEFFNRCPFCLNNTFKKVLMSESICYQIPMNATPGNVPVVSGLDSLEVVVPDRTEGFLARRTYWRLFLGSDFRLGESTRRYAEIYPRQTNTVQFVTHKFVSADEPGDPCIQLDPNSTYSYARCVLKCFVQKYVGFEFLMIACDETLPECDNDQMVPNKTYQFYNEHLWEHLAFLQTTQKGGEEAEPECYDHKRCPSMCERKIYTMDVQSHPLTPVVDYGIPVGNESIYANLSTVTVATPENLTRIYFLNSAAVYGGVLTFREVSTYSFATMVGNIGGMLSLWLGVSVMGLIQIIMFFVTEWCAGMRRQHRRVLIKNKTQKSPARHRQDGRSMDAFIERTSSL